MILLALITAATFAAPDAPTRVLPTFATRVAPRVITADSARIARGGEFASVGRLSEARRLFVESLKASRRSGEFGGDALWHLALLAYGAGQELRAAALLDELADEAARFGETTWQARGLLEAGLIYQALGQRTEAAARSARLQPLLQSSAISASDRAMMVARMGRDK